MEKPTQISISQQMRVNPHRRLKCDNVDLEISVGNGVHFLTVALAYDAQGVLREINFVSRGKIGQGVDQMLHELGIQLSRAIQGRDPKESRSANTSQKL